MFSLVADPVGFGLVESLSRPGGNVTGFVVWDVSIGGKWIQLLQEIAPDLDHIGIMFNPETGPYAPGLVASAKASATKNVIVADIHARNAGDMSPPQRSLEADQTAGSSSSRSPLLTPIGTKSLPTAISSKSRH